MGHSVSCGFRSSWRRTPGSVRGRGVQVGQSSSSKWDYYLSISSVSGEDAACTSVTSLNMSMTSPFQADFIIWSGAEYSQNGRLRITSCAAGLSLLAILYSGTSHFKTPIIIPCDTDLQMDLIFSRLRAICTHRMCI